MMRHLSTRNMERSIPERVPLMLVEHLLGDFAYALLQSGQCLLIETPVPRSHPELRRSLAGNRTPCPCLVPDCQLGDGRVPSTMVSRSRSSTSSLHPT